MKYTPGQHTKKTLGQHWLRDAATLQAIVSAAEIKQGDAVLEIGPGLGTLTDVLLRNKANITALEYDQDLIPGLEKKYKNLDSVAIIEGDIRTFDFTTMQSPYKVVANIPYYLTSHLIRSMSESINPPERAVLLIQKEVAQRICAVPGDMGILSVTAQFYFECELSVEVPAELFSPPPKVDSQVIVMKHRAAPLFPVDEKDFFRFLKSGFSEKRKTLRNTLSGGLHIDKKVVESILNETGLPATSRAQELSLKQWYELYLSYYGSQKYETHKKRNT